MESVKRSRPKFSFFANKRARKKTSDPITHFIQNVAPLKSPKMGRQLNDPKKPSLESVLEHASVLACTDKSGNAAVNFVASDLGLSRKQAREALVAAGILHF